MKQYKSYLAICLAVVALFGAGAVLCSGIFTAVTAVSGKLEQPSMTLVLDAGHGGEDGGAVSCTGVNESQINLQITQRLDGLLQLLGYRTHMLRTGDTALYDASASTYSEKKVSDLKNRAATVNSISGAVLISIHQNQFPQSQYRGAQVFYAADETSKAFASVTQDTLKAVLDPVNRRAPKQADGIYLLEQIQCPGILVECGFLSNPAEEELLRSEDYQKKLAVALSISVSQWLAQTQQP